MCRTFASTAGLLRADARQKFEAHDFACADPFAGGDGGLDDGDSLGTIARTAARVSSR
jgi:hypothetical protein